MQLNNKPVYGNDENLDVFWFKFVRREIFYLRKADGTLLDHNIFLSSKLLRAAEHAWERI